jgi:hypothetical protein
VTNIVRWADNTLAVVVHALASQLYTFVLKMRFCSSCESMDFIRITFIQPESVGGTTWHNTQCDTIIGSQCIDPLEKKVGKKEKKRPEFLLQRPQEESDLIEWTPLKIWILCSLQRASHKSGRGRALVKATSTLSPFIRYHHMCVNFFDFVIFFLSQ